MSDIALRLGLLTGVLLVLGIGGLLALRSENKNHQRRAHKKHQEDGRWYREDD